MNHPNVLPFEHFISAIDSVHFQFSAVLALMLLHVLALALSLISFYARTFEGEDLANCVNRKQFNKGLKMKLIILPIDGADVFTQIF